MCRFTFAVVLATVLLATLALSLETERDGLPVVNYKDGEPCPATVFYDNCNICFCHENGQAAACSRMYCDPEVTAYGGEPESGAVEAQIPY